MRIKPLQTDEPQQLPIDPWYRLAANVALRSSRGGAVARS